MTDKIKITFKKSPAYYIGNIMMGISLLFLVYIYSPLFLVYFFPQKIDPSTFKKNTYYIEIPKISAAAPIVLEVNAWDKQEYMKQLKNGVASAIGFALPGHIGTSYLFAHSSDYPWNITRYNTAFFRLGEIEQGDEIIITKNNETYSYFVYDKKTVWPSDVNALRSAIATDSSRLILQTCTPIGTSFQRLLIFAKGN